MKKIISLFLAVVMIFTALPMGVLTVGADEFISEDGNYNITVDDGKATINHCTEPAVDGVLALPESIDGYIVTGIGAYAFDECYEATEIVIPESITNIQPLAFAYMPKVQKITVDEENLNYCTLNGVVFSKDMKTLIAYPSDNDSCTYTVPDGVTIIAESAFMDCDNLYEIILPDSLTEIGMFAFSESSCLVSIKIPAGVTEIKRGTFFNCSKLRSIAIPASVTAIGVEAFWDNYNLWHILYEGTENLWWEISVEVDNENLYNAFVHYEASGSEITVELTQAPTCTEWGNIRVSCEACMEDVYSEIYSLGHKAGEFINRIEASCAQMGYDVYNCTVCGENFETNEIYIEHTKGELIETVEPTCIYEGYDIYKCIVCDMCFETNWVGAMGHTVNDSETFTTCTFGTVSKGECSVCSEVIVSLDYSGEGHQFEDGICTVCGVDSEWNYSYNEYYNCIELHYYRTDKENVVLPETIEGIPLGIFMSSFYDCPNLKNLTIPASITSINEGAFSGNYNLESITVAEGNKNYISVDGVLFNKSKDSLICFPAGKKLGAYTVPETVTVIKSYAFSNNRYLFEVNLPEKLKTIGDYAFSWSSNLLEINIPASVETIGYTALGGCQNLKNITIAEKNENYASKDGVLYDKKYETLITYPAGKTEGMFTINDGVISIEDLAFSFSRYLIAVIIPESVTNIGEMIFKGCDILWHSLYKGEEENLIIGEFNETLWQAIHFGANGNEVTIAYDGQLSCSQTTNVVAECSICNGTNNFEVLSWHKQGEFIKTVKSTCVNQGYDVYLCSVCGQDYQTNWTDSFGHDAEYTETFETCSFGTVSKGLCNNCGEYVYEI